jgi:DNA-binding response OmpR family regulator
MMARVDALLRRRRWHGPGEQVVIGRLRVDFRSREAWCDDAVVHLTDMELRVLEYLVTRAGDVVSREELLERVWRLSPQSKTRTVDVFMSRLRKSVEKTEKAKVLVTVRGEGYRLILSPSSSV